MFKFSSPSDFNFGIEPISIIREPIALEKRASARELMNWKPTKGQTDLHVIALGSGEYTGMNRNGDIFTEDDCRKKHGTFVESGRVHRNHKNKKTDPVYGTIKASAYNEKMGRLELILGLDDDKCADILDEQEKTGNTNWSMGASVHGDTCTWCQKFAKDDSERCEHVPTKLGEINKHGVQCGMKNDVKKWFELSKVKRPADRIGMSLKKLSSELAKTSSSNILELYRDDIELPSDTILISKTASAKRGLLVKLAAMEKKIDAGGEHVKTQIAAEKTKASLSQSTIDELRKQDPAKLLKVLADNGIVLSPEDFSKYLFENRVSDKQMKGMKTHLPDIFSNLTDEEINDEKFDPSFSDIIPKEIRNTVSKLIGDHSLFDKPTHNRVMRITIIKSLPKEIKKEEKTKEAFDKEFAKVYASYKLAALNYMADANILDEDVLKNAVIQNRL